MLIYYSNYITLISVLYIQGLIVAQQLQQQADGDDIEAEAADLEDKVDMLTAGSAQLENERDILMAEKVSIAENTFKLLVQIINFLG